MTMHNEADTLYSQIMPQTRAPKSEEELIKQAVLRLNGHVLGFVLGVIGALVIFVATNWLVIKGGDVVGPHLGLLGQFFLGYSVTFTGSLIGAAYFFVVGYVSGLLIGWIYNGVVFLKSGRSNSEKDK